MLYDILEHVFEHCETSSELYILNKITSKLYDHVMINLKLIQEMFLVGVELEDHKILQSFILKFKLDNIFTERTFESSKKNLRILQDLSFWNYYGDTVKSDIKHFLLECLSDDEIILAEDDEDFEDSIQILKCY
jgi:hypothetical protein